MDKLSDLDILNVLELESGSSPTPTLNESSYNNGDDESSADCITISLQSASEENGTSSYRPTRLSDHQVGETPGIDFALEEVQAAGSEYDYVILSEVNNVTVEYIENNGTNDLGLELEMDGEIEMAHEMSVNEIGEGVVDDGMALVNVNMGEEANETANEDGDEMQLNDEIIDDNLSDDAVPQPNRTRKRLCRPETWKRNIRKKHHQAGLEYINEKGKTVLKKVLTSKKDCLNKCKYKCSKSITENERISIFNGYYGLKTKNEKQLFIVNNTERVIKNRKTKKNDEIPSRRQFTFKYFFTVKGEKVQVCQPYFLSTLQISQKPVYNVHLSKNVDTGLPKSDGRGLKKNTGVPETCKNDVRNHIKSFPVLESHYCRADSKKLYLESTLNIRKMFELFKEKYPNSNVKESMYRHIFMTEFNLDFHVPKKDRCDLCEEYAVAVKEKIPFNENKYTTHLAAKTAMRAERKSDREGDNPVLSFDLQNVISCPRAEISSLFYYSKLSVYNLTAHLKTANEKKVYCAIWPETMGGRGGNDIASAVFKIVNKVLEENPSMETLTTWSDSCVPQNRNQMMSGAMMEVLKQHPALKSISMKYSTPGHGAVQEVDNIHSQIEKVFNISEYYSPISMLRILLKVNKKNPFNIIQMTNQDFLDFEESSKDLAFKRIPFAKVSCITFTQVFGEVEYAEVHGGDKVTTNIKLDTPKATRNERKRGKGVPKCSENRTNQTLSYKTPKRVKKIQKLSTLKMKHLQEMERFMPLFDREYYKAILKTS